MKNKLTALIVTCLILFSLTGCSTSYQDATTPDTTMFGHGYFTGLKQWGSEIYEYHMMYANDTKVMYFVVIDTEGVGITPLYNADGTLQVYKGQ